MVQNANTMLTQSSIIDAEDFVGHRLVGFRRLYNLTKVHPSLRGGRRSWGGRVWDRLTGKTPSADHKVVEDTAAKKKFTGPWTWKEVKKHFNVSHGFLEHGLTGVAKELNEINQEIAKQQDAIKKKEDEIAKQKAAIEANKNQYTQDIQAKDAAIEANKKQYTQDIKAKDAVIEAKEEQITRKQAVIVQIEKDLDEARKQAEKLFAQTTLQKQNIEKLNKDLTGMTDKLKEATTHLQKLKTDFAPISESVESYKERLDEGSVDDTPDNKIDIDTSAAPAAPATPAVTPVPSPESEISEQGTDGSGKDENESQPIKAGWW